MDFDDFDLLKEKLGNRIRTLREGRGLKVRAFALIADVEHPQLVNIEKGRVDVKLATLYKIAKGFEIEVKELFDFGQATSID